MSLAFLQDKSMSDSEEEEYGKELYQIVNRKPDDILDTYQTDTNQNVQIMKHGGKNNFIQVILQVLLQYSYIVEFFIKTPLDKAKQPLGSMMK